MVNFGDAYIESDDASVFLPTEMTEEGTEAHRK